MNNFLVTIVTFLDVREQPVRIQCVICHTSANNAVSESLSTLEKSSLLSSCVRSISVVELSDDYDYLQMYKLPNSLI